MKRKPSHHRDDTADRVAIRVLEWLVGDEDRVLAFLQATGLSPSDLRDVAQDPGFLAAVLDHVMADESLLLACASALELTPERIAAAWQRRRPPDFDHTL